MTALDYVCTTGELEVAQWLVEHGADPAQRSDYNNTTLHYAANYGQSDVVKWYISIRKDLRLSTLFRGVCSVNAPIPPIHLQWCYKREPCSIARHSQGGGRTMHVACCYTLALVPHARFIYACAHSLYLLCPFVAPSLLSCIITQRSVAALLPQC